MWELALLWVALHQLPTLSCFPDLRSPGKLRVLGEACGYLRCPLLLPGALARAATIP